MPHKAIVVGQTKAVRSAANAARQDALGIVPIVLFVLDATTHRDFQFGRAINVVITRVILFPIGMASAPDKRAAQTMAMVPQTFSRQ